MTFEVVQCVRSVSQESLRHPHQSEQNAESRGQRQFRHRTTHLQPVQLLPPPTSVIRPPDGKPPSCRYRVQSWRHLSEKRYNDIFYDRKVSRQIPVRFSGFSPGKKQGSNRRRAFVARRSSPSPRQTGYKVHGKEEKHNLAAYFSGAKRTTTARAPEVGVKKKGSWPAVDVDR